GVRPQQPAERAQQGGLAAAVGPDDGGHRAVGEREVEVARDDGVAVAEGGPLGAEPGALRRGRGGGVGRHRRASRCRTMIRYMRNGAPSTEVKTPTGSWTGNSPAASWSAPRVSAPPSRVEASTGGSGERQSRSAICGAASATKLIGPAAAVAAQTSRAAQNSRPARARSTR